MALNLAVVWSVWTTLIFCFAVGQTDPGYAGPWRWSLDEAGSCWTDSSESCNRALTIVHGGDWNLQYPYDSMPAFQRGFDNQADAVKGDFRVNGENVGMVMHSSPIEIYESFNCFNKKVEEMTTAKCEQCKMEVTDYTFISVPEMLSWSGGKVNVMLCIKESSDIPRAISTLVENNATHRAFLEVGVNDFLNTAKSNVEGWDSVYWIIEIQSTADVQTLAAQSANLLKRAILIEFQNSWDWQTPISADIDTVHKLGLRAVGVTKSNTVMATVNQHLEIFHMGFDVVYTYNLANAVSARVQVNEQRGLAMP
jgi:hypothetical protein